MFSKTKKYLKGTRRSRKSRGTKRTNKNKYTKKTRQITSKILKKAEFPYYRLFKTQKEILADFQKLKVFKPKLLRKNPTKQKIVQFSGQGHIIFIEDYQKNVPLYKLTDYFSQKCRVKCVFNPLKDPKKGQSMLDQYSKLKTNIFKELGESFSYYQLDDYLYAKKIRECSNFHTTVVVSVLKLFKPKYYLDFSAGWGDRLVGAIAYDCQEYVGVDPSECMQSHYKSIIETLVPKKKQSQFRIIQKGFEEVSLPDNHYDLVFTSPPFFTLEIYENTPQQSVIKFKNLQEWKTGFLFPSLVKCYGTLRKGGYLALYISDYSTAKYTGDMKNYINKKLKGFKYMGDIHWMDRKTKKIRNINCWKKEY